MINSIIHHIGIAVSDPASAEAFFDALLVDRLGMEKEQVWEACAGWKGRGSRIYLYKSAGIRDSHSLQHLAFAARSRAEVDDFAAWAERQGVTLLAGPKDFPEYGGDYYALFFLGPEGMKLELVHLTEKDGSCPL